MFNQPIEQYFVIPLIESEQACLPIAQATIVRLHRAAQLCQACVRSDTVILRLYAVH
jgi:hypothetical protein